ncbi:hypothetical protein [Actinophytocola sediminis]
MNPEPSADEADILEQSREVGADTGTDTEQEPPATADAEADSADLHDQSLPVPADDEDRRDG